MIILSEVIVVALITGICSVIGQWLISKKARQEDAIKQAKRDQHLDDTIQGLSDRVDKHNQYAEMFAGLSSDIRLMAKDIAYIKEGKL